jgi:thiazole synthase
MNTLKKDNPLIINKKKFSSRLLLGTGKFPSAESMKQSIEASGAEIITVALRRVDLNDKSDQFINTINQDKYVFLPNTSGARSATEAVRIARLARNLIGTTWLKLEVTPDPKYLLPDPIETLHAAKTLIKDGFTVLPYINADPILAKHLEEAGCATVMPLGSPIGSNKGLKTIDQIKIIIEQSHIPVVVDAGLGSPSHAALAMELGADAVLVNTAIAIAGDPVTMAESFKLGVVSGRMAYLSDPGHTLETGSASSPLKGILSGT